MDDLVQALLKADRALSDLQLRELLQRAIGEVGRLKTEIEARSALSFAAGVEATRQSVADGASEGGFYILPMQETFVADSGMLGGQEWRGRTIHGQLRVTFGGSPTGWMVIEGEGTYQYPVSETVYPSMELAVQQARAEHIRRVRRWVSGSEHTGLSDAVRVVRELVSAFEGLDPFNEWSGQAAGAAQMERALAGARSFLQLHGGGDEPQPSDRKG